MRKTLLFITLISLLPLAGFADSLRYVLANPESFDSKEVTIAGEAIGELINSDNGVWLNILSEDFHIGIFSKDPDKFSQITHWGQHKIKGDIVSVKGVFHKDCSLHKISDVHLQSLEIVRTGKKIDRPIAAFKEGLAMLLLIICLTSALIYFIKLRHERAS